MKKYVEQTFNILKVNKLKAQWKSCLEPNAYRKRFMRFMEIVIESNDIE